MTSTGSAADIGSPSDRRSFLSTAAMASVGALAAAFPAAASPFESPGPIEIAYFEYVRASKLADAAAEATWEVEDRYEEPERPRWHPITAEGGYKLEVIDRENKKCRCYLNDSDENIAELRTIIASSDPGADHGPRIERAKKTLAEILDWKSECRRRADAIGLTAAREFEEPLQDAMNERHAAVLALDPANYREAAFQAAALSLDWDERAVNRFLARLTELAGIPSYFEGEPA